MHFDEVPFLKFFLYLTDTEKGSGALEVIPGSHHDNAENRESQMASGLDWNQIETLVGDGKSPAIPIAGKAGDLIIFTTDISHRAGLIPVGGGIREALQVLATSKRHFDWRRYSEKDHDL